MKKSLLLGIIVVGFLFTKQTVLAVDPCVTNYGDGGLVCQDNAGLCDSSPNVKNFIQTAHQSIKEGVLSADSSYITGQCTGSAVCCMKQQTPAGGATAPAGESGNSSGQSIKSWIESNPAYSMPAGYDGPIPECGFSGTCTDVNDLVEVLIKQGKMIFGLIGMVALASFVYGGFLMVFSFGSSDKIQQGKDVMVAAVIGIVIVFSAYIIVNFVLTTLGVSTDLQAIK